MKQQVLRAGTEPASVAERRNARGATLAPTQLALQDWVDRSPRMVAQRRAIAGLLGDAQGPAQAQGEAAQHEAMPSETTPASRGGLPVPLLSGIAALSGVDLSDVRVHRDSAAPAQLHALAYAQSNEIHVGPGQEAHLPHEAWHVVQQRQGRVRETMRMAGIGVNDDAELEREADRMGARAVSQGTSIAADGRGHPAAMPAQRSEREGSPTASNGLAATISQRRAESTVVELDHSPTAALASEPGQGHANTNLVRQCANILWSKGDPPVITEIDFGKRSGQQDDHATAYTVFELGVLQNLGKKPLQEAIIQLLLLANEIIEFPSFLEYKDQGLANKVNKLKADLNELLQGLLDKTFSPLYAGGQLGRLIDDYLRVRNLVPGTKMDKTDAIRPQGAPTAGDREKKGKAALLESASKLESGSSVSDVQPKIQEALDKLHDYITTRKEMPSVAQFISYAAQHFTSLLQAVPTLVPHAEEILEIWMNQIYDKWAKLLKLEWSSFAREMVGLSGWYVKQVGAAEVGPLRLSLSNEELDGLGKGRLPHEIFNIFIRSRARVFILNDSARLVITGYSGDSIQFRFGPLGG